MIVKKHNGMTVIVVSHGDPITAAFAKLSDIPLIGETFDKHLPAHAHGIQIEFDIKSKLSKIAKFTY